MIAVSAGRKALQYRQAHTIHSQTSSRGNTSAGRLYVYHELRDCLAFCVYPEHRYGVCRERVRERLGCVVHNDIVRRNFHRVGE